MSGGGRWLAGTRFTKKKGRGQVVLLLERRHSSRRRCRRGPDKSRFWRWSLGSRSGESGRATHGGPLRRPATDNFFCQGGAGARRRLRGDRDFVLRAAASLGVTAPARGFGAGREPAPGAGGVRGLGE